MLRALDFAGTAVWRARQGQVCGDVDLAQPRHAIRPTDYAACATRITGSGRAQAVRSAARAASTLGR